VQAFAQFLSELGAIGLMALHMPRVDLGMGAQNRVDLGAPDRGQRRGHPAPRCVRNRRTALGKSRRERDATDSTAKFPLAHAGFGTCSRPARDTTNTPGALIDLGTAPEAPIHRSKLDCAVPTLDRHVAKSVLGLSEKAHADRCQAKSCMLRCGDLCVATPKPLG